MSESRETTSGPAAQAAFATGPGDVTATAVLTRTACSDGMSDRAFGLRLELILSEADGRNLLSGCCSLQTAPLR